MKQTETKIPCTVNKQYEGIAHLIEVQYDEHFGVWFGRVDVACTVEVASSELTWTEVVLELEDGRMGRARTLAGLFEATYLAVEGRTLGESCTLYFLGLCRLAAPVTAPCRHE